jgi:protein-S-isoprenylcysteine O-methyltransferase Ste14
MRKTQAVAWSSLFTLIVPGAVGGVVPWWISGWQFQPAFFDSPATRFIGVLLIGMGLVPLLESIARFALEGLGTPVPAFPTSHLVVTGFYRHVRNPMYVGMLGVILGQTLLFGDVRLLAYAAAFGLCAHAFILGYEEPTLRRQFGAEYAAFCRHVPRWTPRLLPWKGDVA